MRWMHLSDIHLNKDFNHLLSNTLRDELPIYIEKQHLTADGLFVTGDYRDAALSEPCKEKLDEQAQTAADYILRVAKALHVPSQRIYLVPGNHDLSRSGSDREKIEQVRAVYPKYRESFPKDLREYFVKRFAFFEEVDARVHMDRPREAHSAFHQYIEGDGFDILRLNTALICDGTEGERELLIDAIAINEELKSHQPADPSKPLFVLAHHSMEFLTAQEEENLKNILRNRRVFYLCGHSHRCQFGYDDDSNLWQIMASTTKHAKRVKPVFCMGEDSGEGAQFSLQLYQYDLIDGNGWMLCREICHRPSFKRLAFASCNFAKAGETPLPLGSGVHADDAQMSEAIQTLSQLIHRLRTEEGAATYLVTSAFLSVNAGILIGYALHIRGSAKLYYQVQNTVFLNDQSGNVPEFDLSLKEDAIDTHKPIQLCVYIQAKEDDTGTNIFYNYVEDRGFENVCRLVLLNQERYDEHINLEETAKWLVGRILERHKVYEGKKARDIHVHLFFNGFWGLALLLGNQLPTTYPIQLYDYDGRQQTYYPSFQLCPGIFDTGRTQSLDT